MAGGRKKSRQRAERITGNHSPKNAKAAKKKTAGKKKTVLEAKKAQLRATRRKRKNFR